MSQFAEVRVEMLEESNRVLRGALRRAVGLLREAAEPESHYGSPMSDDPRELHPDPECSTEAERALHQSLCDAWNRGENTEIPPDHVTLRDDEGKVVAIGSIQPLGLGTTTIRNLEAEGALAEAVAALRVMP